MHDRVSVWLPRHLRQFQVSYSRRDYKGTGRTSPSSWSARCDSITQKHTLTPFMNSLKCGWIFFKWFILGSMIKELADSCSLHEKPRALARRKLLHSLDCCRHLKQHNSYHRHVAWKKLLSWTRRMRRARIRNTRQTVVVPATELSQLFLRVLFRPIATTFKA